MAAPRRHRPIPAHDATSRTERRLDAIGGALSLALGLCLLLWLIPHWVEPDPDLRLPVGLVPQVVAAMFVLCGAAMLARAALARRGRGADGPPGFDDGELRGLLVMTAVLLCSTAGFQFLHFMVAAPALVAVSMWVFGPLRPVSLVVTAAAGPAAVWVVFTHMLGRVLP